MKWQKEVQEESVLLLFLSEMDKKGLKIVTSSPAHTGSVLSLCFSL